MPTTTRNFISTDSLRGFNGREALVCVIGIAIKLILGRRLRITTVIGLLLVMLELFGVVFAECQVDTCSNTYFAQVILIFC